MDGRLLSGRSGNNHATLAGIRKQLAQIAEEIENQIPDDTPYPMHLLSDDEQERFTAFLHGVGQKRLLDLSQLTNEELDTLEQWVKLGHARRAEHPEAANTYLKMYAFNPDDDGSEP